jgi:arsenate reductase
MITLYTYAKCSTCRKATAYLAKRGLAFTERPIREQPPTLAELRAMLKAQGGELRRLFNVSGQDYRELELKDKLPAMSVDQALALLAANGNLVKRPFVPLRGGGLVGFDPAAWDAAL